MNMKNFTSAKLIKIRDILSTKEIESENDALTMLELINCR